MTVDEAIEALGKVRDRIGGQANLMLNEFPVAEIDVAPDGDFAYVSNIPNAFQEMEADVRCTLEKRGIKTTGMSRLQVYQVAEALENPWMANAE